MNKFEQVHMVRDPHVVVVGNEYMETPCEQTG